MGLASKIAAKWRTFRSHGGRHHTTHGNADAGLTDTATTAFSQNQVDRLHKGLNPGATNPQPSVPDDLPIAGNPNVVSDDPSESRQDLGTSDRAINETTSPIVSNNLKSEQEPDATNPANPVQPVSSIPATSPRLPDSSGSALNPHPSRDPTLHLATDLPQETIDRSTNRNASTDSSVATPLIVMDDSFLQDSTNLSAVKDVPRRYSSQERILDAQLGATFGAGMDLSQFARGRPGPLTESSVTDLDSIIPTKVDCSLHLTYDGQSAVNGSEIQPIPLDGVEWNTSAAFDRLNNTAHERLKEAVPILQDNDSIYRRQGTCRIICGHHAKEPLDLVHRGHWPEIPSRLINEFVNVDANLYRGFHLRINWDFSALQLHSQATGTFAAMVRGEIYRKMKTNFKGDRYIPRVDLFKIVSAQTIPSIVQSWKQTLEGSSPCAAAIAAKPYEEDVFVREIQKNAVRLLAMCVYCNIDLLTLKRLLDHKIDDNNLPLNYEDMCQRCDCIEKVDLSSLISNQGSFLPHRFRKVHEEVPRGIVLPIFYDKDEHKLGRGAHGDVFKVTIDPNNHEFSRDRNKSFALKIFHWRASMAFQQEKEMLQRLSLFPHKHILRYETTWAQDEFLYMLFPCAEKRSLAQYLDHEEPRQLTEDFVLWLFRQFRGLADAVRVIHQFGGHKNLLSPQQKGQMTGFHHDIKPDNILVFADEKDEYGVFLIADFGTAKINLLRSGQQSRFVEKGSGDPTYEAPDVRVQGRLSRPQDMWSLGCVFLEIMCWTFRLYKDREAFSNERSIINDKNKECESDAFWRDTGNTLRPHVVLKPAVEKRLVELEEICMRKRGFRRMLDLIRQLLNVQAAERTLAEKLHTDIDAIVRQAEQDLKENPDCYTSEVGFPPEQYSPPSPAPGSRRHLSMPSLEEDIPDAPLEQEGLQRQRSDSLRPPSRISVRHEATTQEHGGALANMGSHFETPVTIKVPHSPTTAGSSGL